MLIGLLRMIVGTQTPKWVGIVELISAVLYLGVVARESATCWQDGIDTTFLPLVLLVAAAFAVRSGATHGARSGAALLWFIAPGIVLVLLAGIGELQEPVAVPVNRSNPWITAPLLLLPFLGGRAAEQNGRKLSRTVMLLSCIALAATLWLNGEQIPETAENAFYEYSKGITLFGAAERFEAVSACLLTAGWFALFSFLLSIVYEIAEELKEGWGRWSLWIALAMAGLIMYNLPIPLPIVGILCVISWGFLPLITQVLVGLKKSKKHGKTS